MTEKKQACVYIDEAGDLGINRGTRWFVITGVIVAQEDEKHIRDTITLIKNKLNLHEIHLRKIHDFYKISYIISKLKDENFTIINVLTDTNICHLRDSILTYNFMCRILLERASWYLRDHDMGADIVLSSRGTSRDKELICYIKEKLLNYAENQIVSDRFNKIKSKAACDWDMLQLADVCATSMFKAYETNAYGFVTPCYMSNLKDKIYRYNGKIDKYGIKFFSDDMKPSADYFKNHRICTKK